MLFPNAGVEVSPVLLLFLGLVVGTLSGFFGVGGGFLITGGLLVFGVPPLFAVGTGLTLIVGSSIINTLKHRRIGNVDIKLGALMVVGTVPAVFLAEELNQWLEKAGVAGPVLRYTYVVVLAALAGYKFYDHWKASRWLVGGQGDAVSTSSLIGRVHALRIPPASIPVPWLGRVFTTTTLPKSGIERISVWVPVGIGSAIGFMAGLLGAGGGFILLPVLIFVLGVPTTVAVGTDLFQVVITGSVGSFLYSLEGRVDLVMSVMMLGTASAGSQLGVAAARYVDGARIRFLFGLTMIAGSVSVALREVSESVSGLDYLADMGSVLLLGTAGAMCRVVGGLLVAAKRKNRAEFA
ncbi:MAG: sulfite exporter TauE/SafE family protein [Dehalococcoidia bacterium]|nr:sulfite exporter TauE/SafE family protein [Dehalococcoidia bacterium]